MYAIVEIAGQQFKVEKDQQVYVHRLENKEGSKVETKAKPAAKKTATKKSVAKKTTTKKTTAKKTAPKKAK